MIGTYDIVSTIAQQFPTYCFLDRCMGHGVIGGSYPDSVRTGNRRWRVGGADPVRRGSRQHSRHPRSPGASFTSIGALFAAGTFRNLHSRRERLSRYRQPTPWERYGKYIGAVLLLVLVQAVLIIGLLWQRAREPQGRSSVCRESEKRFRLMADTTPALVWMCDGEGTSPI